MVADAGKLPRHTDKLTNLQHLVAIFKAGNISGKQEIGNYCIVRRDKPKYDKPENQPLGAVASKGTS
jgi:hypothetical protein